MNQRRLWESWTEEEIFSRLDSEFLGIRDPKWLEIGWYTLSVAFRFNTRDTRRIGKVLSKWAQSRGRDARAEVTDYVDRNAYFEGGHWGWKVKWAPNGFQYGASKSEIVDKILQLWHLE